MESKKNDSSAAYLVYLLQKLTSLNTMPNLTGIKISAKTIKNAVKFVQSLTKLNPDIINIDISTTTYVGPYGPMGVVFTTRHVLEKFPSNQLQVLISEDKSAIRGIFLTNQISISDIASNPSGIKLLIQMEKMHISYLTDTTY